MAIMQKLLIIMTSVDLECHYSCEKHFDSVTYETFYTHVYTMICKQKKNVVLMEFHFVI